MAKGNLLKKVLAYGMFSFLALSSLFPLKAFAETILDKTCKIDFRLPGAFYGKNEKPSTNLRVKVDINKEEGNEYNLDVSFFTEDWDAKKGNFFEYVTIYNTYSRLCVSHPKKVYLDQPKEMVYAVKRRSFRDKEMSGSWEEVFSIDESPSQNRKLKIMKVVTDVVSSKVGGRYITEFGEIESSSKETSKELFRGLYDKESRFSDVPFYPSDCSNLTARRFKIPIEVSEYNNDIKKIKVLLCVSVKRGPSASEEIGQLEKLVIDVPLR